MADDTITGIHYGKTIVVGGTSPERANLMLSDVPIVIGVNRYIEDIHCHYWLTCDTHKIAERMPNVIPLLGNVKTFMNSAHALPEGVPEPNYWFRRPDGPVDRNIQPVGNYTVPAKWCGELQHVWTSATAAVNLAAIMGARRIVLHGVDLVGDTNTAYNNPSNYTPKPWADFADDVSRFLRAVSVICPVYKTNPKSPIKVPLLL